MAGRFIHILRCMVPVALVTTFLGLIFACALITFLKDISLPAYPTIPLFPNATEIQYSEDLYTQTTHFKTVVNEVEVRGFYRTILENEGWHKLKDENKGPSGTWHDNRELFTSPDSKPGRWPVIFCVEIRANSFQKDGGSTQLRKTEVTVELQRKFCPAIQL